MAKRVITFGEIMMRLNPIGYLRLVQSDRFEATYAGGEANVAVSLANYGLDAAYVTKVPAHEVGQCAVNELRRYGVDTQYMVRGGDRLGIYFCERARRSAHPRSSMTAPALPSRWQSAPILTGIPSLTVQTGFTGPASPRRSAANCPKFVWTPARRPRRAV